MATSDTLLSIVTSFCRRRGIAVPGSVVGSSDETYLQMWELLNEEVEQLLGRGQMSFFRFRMDSIIMDAGAFPFSAFNPPCAYPVLNTLYEVTTKLPVAGPLTPADWQQMIVLNVSPATYSYTIRQSTLLIWPIPITANFSWEYYTDSPCINPNPLGIIVDVGTDGPVPRESPAVFGQNFTADNSYSLIPTKILKAGLTWRWLKVKGLPYAEDYAAYERIIAIEDQRDGSAGEVHADWEGDCSIARPGLLIPAGNWNV